MKATNSWRSANYPQNNSKPASRYLRSTSVDQLSLIVRTFQHTGLPHPVLSSSTSANLVMWNRLRNKLETRPAWLSGTKSSKIAVLSKVARFAADTAATRLQPSLLDIGHAEMTQIFSECTILLQSANSSESDTVNAPPINMNWR